MDGHVGGATVSVWMIRTDPSDDRLRALATVLDDAERRRADEIRPPLERRRYVAVHGAVRLILAARLGVPAADLRWRRGENGKPTLTDRDDLQVNLSHSEDLAMLAIATGVPVGVDVQRMQPRVDVARMAERYFPAAEAAYVAEASAEERAGRFFALWTRKEACLKAVGARLMQGLRLPVLGTDPVVRDPSGRIPGPLAVRDVAAPQGFRAAVAVRGARPFPVATDWWAG
jgi:4'-phosphopantetheinyl transferase